MEKNEREKTHTVYLNVSVCGCHCLWLFQENRFSMWFKTTTTIVIRRITVAKAAQQRNWRTNGWNLCREWASVFEHSRVYAFFVVLFLSLCSGLWREKKQHNIKHTHSHDHYKVPKRSWTPWSKWPRLTIRIVCMHGTDFVCMLGNSETFWIWMWERERECVWRFGRGR